MSMRSGITKLIVKQTDTLTEKCEKVVKKTLDECARTRKRGREKKR